MIDKHQRSAMFLSRSHLFQSVVFTTVLAASFGVSAELEKEDKLRAYYDSATHIESASGNFFMKAELRLQFRASTPFDNNPTTIAALDGADAYDASLNRSRLKFEGHAYRPWLNYKVEYDFNNSTLLDGRMTAWYSDALGFRLGRYKVNFNRERVTSSKDLQLVDRSAVNNYFTLDRQQGVSVLGRLGEGSAFDGNYSIEVFGGTGRQGENANDHILTVARYQWHFLGGNIETAMGDLKKRQEPVASIGVAAASNISPYTAFNSSGGTQLPGFVDGEYKVDQWMLDINYKYKGISFQGEYHQKEIEDRQAGGETALSGYVLNFGVFANLLNDKMPESLELVARYSHVDPNDQVGDDDLSESTLGFNWYFNGHRNKISFDAGNYGIDEGGNNTSRVRYRLQWDVSF